MSDDVSLDCASRNDDMQTSFFSAKLHLQSWAASELKTLQVQARGAEGINMEYIYVHAAMGIFYQQLLLDR